MLDAYLNRLKFFFIAVIILIVGTLVFGAFLIERSAVFTSRSINQTVSFLMYRTEFTLSDTARSGLLASLTSVTGSPLRYEDTLRRTGSVPILVYHGILDESDGSSVNIAEKNFKDHLFSLAQAGFHSITLAEFDAFLRGEGAIPTKSVLITFDDGRMDSYERGDPILRAVGYSAVMFAISKYSIDRASNYYLTPSLMRRMEATGRWDIQVHTHDGHETYPASPNGMAGNFYSHLLWLPAEERMETLDEYDHRIANDIATAKNKIDTELQKNTRAFAFPFGDFGQLDTNIPDSPESRILRRAYEHFSLLFYQFAPGKRYQQAYPTTQDDTSFLIKRINVDGRWSGEELLGIIHGSTAKSVDFQDTFEHDRGWVSSWGEVAISPEGNRGLYLSAQDGASGAAAILDGTRIWRNYEIISTVRSPLQNGAFLWVRFQDDHNNAACNFGNGFAHVEQTVGGEKRVIQGNRSEAFVIPSDSFTIGARVSGRSVQCLLNGKILAESNFLDRSLDTGGIGFKTWDPSGRPSSFVVEHVDVKEI